jgi:amino acid adenylation domain-containing protein
MSDESEPSMVKPATAQTVPANIRSVPEQISFARQNNPCSIALSYGSQQLTYEAFDHRGNQFAAYLVDLGITPGDAVAICMERSFDWIICALGIMRAGAAYVPLDPAWPDSRLQFAVKDSGATVLVARTTFIDRLQVRARGIDPCRDAAAVAAAPAGVCRAVPAESLAYVIYTSGSTGVPKGVEITHANLCHLIRWHREAFGVTPRDRASHVAGLGFDAAVWEIWPNLAEGATVCLADESVRSSPELMRQWLLHERVTIAFVPTVYAAPMFAMEWPATTSLRLMLTGGEVLHHAPTTPLPFNVVNNYGPTECTVVATSAVLKSDSVGAPPIGRPVAGTSVYLLNEHGEQVPDGSTGEVYIGGNGVGRGYRNLPDSTQRAFLPDTFVGTPGARMYRTGDRGIRRLNGEIEFRGRLDRQTKIRGQRVELDEITSILILHPSIDFATAITSISRDGENQLVAYILPKENARVPTVHELQEHLQRSLPDYMVPDIFVRLHALPLSGNGKLDLTMLAHPTDANLLQEPAARVPTTPVKQKLLTLVQRLLENDAVRAEDSFFLAGGHSLLGMQLVMRVRIAFGVDLTLRQLFEAPTVERLALLIENKLEEEGFAVNPTAHQRAKLEPRRRKNKPGPPDGVLALQPYGFLPSIFWVHNYPSVDLAKVVGDDQPLFSVMFTPEDFSSLRKSPTLQSFAGCLLHKIRATQSAGPYTIGGFCLGGLLAYEIASQLRAAGQEVSLVVMLDPPNPTRIESCDSLTDIVGYLRYVLKRAVRLGPRVSLIYLREHLLKRFARLIGTKPANAGMGAALQTAALAYRPEKYDGKVLLILASERPPHANFLPGWQEVVPCGLHTSYVGWHHRDFLKTKSVPSVADAMVSHLTSASDDRSRSFCADTARPTAPVQTGNRTGARKPRGSSQGKMARQDWRR